MLECINIERPENWNVSAADGLGYLYKNHDYYDYLEKYYHLLEYSITTVPRGYYILALPESEIILEYNEESGKYEYYERED